MNLNDLQPGMFFKFDQPGYEFRQCLFVGIDHLGQVNFIHHNATGTRFLRNDEISQEENPKVTLTIQTWEP